METSEIARVLAEWAERKPLVKRVFIFGSRVRGDHKADSDIDIAVELDAVEYQRSDESGGLDTWIHAKQRWKEELQTLIPNKVQLELWSQNMTPTIDKGLAQSSQLVYDKAT